jgi:NAD-dependent DNA ligase
MENPDLTTVEGAQEARRFALTEMNDPSTANAIGKIIDELTPQSLSETLSNVRDLDPSYVKAEQLLETTGRYRALNELGEEDVAGLSALLERTLTSTTENDIKAASELARFRSAADMVQRFKDFASMTFTGKLSGETRKEYLQIIDALEALATGRMQKTLDTAILNSKGKESEELIRLRSFVLGASNARILN